MTVLEALGVLVAAALTVNFGLYLRSGQLRRHLSCLRVLRGWRWIPALLGSWFVVAVVVVTGAVLIAAWPGVMGWSWLVLLATPAEAPTAGTNLVASGLRVPGFAWVFWILFVLNAPRLAMNEERAFRQWHKTPAAIAVQSVKFGLVHCLVGVPIAFGLALSLAGGWFAVQYLKGGVRRATAYHTLHNWTLLALAALWMAGLL